jgi:DNA-directed RNA polymerase specialized sigma24 family protein
LGGLTDQIGQSREHVWNTMTKMHRLLNDHIMPLRRYALALTRNVDQADALVQIGQLTWRQLDPTRPAPKPTPGEEEVHDHHPADGQD